MNSPQNAAAPLAAIPFNVIAAAGTSVTAIAQSAWSSVAITPNTATEPAQLETLAPTWSPGLDAFAGQGIGANEWESYDVWYRCDFSLDDTHACEASLRFEGLATVAEVWLNGIRLLQSDNMFVQHQLNISRIGQTENTLYIRILALTPQLDARKPRPKWRTPFVNHKNLSWFRTSQIGRIPTWSPPPAIIGPWLPVSIIQQSILSLNTCQLQCSVEGNQGIVNAHIELQALNGKPIDSVQLQVGSHKERLTTVQANSGEQPRYSGQLILRDAQTWWPHTHGEPTRYSASLIVTLEGQEHIIDCEPLGFRTLEWSNLAAALNTKGQFKEDFGLTLNGEKIFCRGACWTPINIQDTHNSEAQYKEALLQLCDAGINMLRISGTFYYEQDVFYRLCDELGILVWQDFMFARLAYPFEDEAFHASAIAEATQVLQRLHFRPSLAILCGNTEIEQQTAMLGLPLEGDLHCFFRETLATLCSEIAPATAYWPSSPAGGDLPFKVTQGVSHYFGVGGYQRGLEDAQLNSPQFASECLAFSNVPENAGLKPFLPDQAGFPTHPDYKAGVARDVSSGWDFADISDHYIERLFHVDTRQLRYQDPQRYFQLSRIACGEIMSKVYGLWRCESSPCNGALIWFLRDLQKGAGWGLIDSQGKAKSVYYYLKRAWAPLGLWFVDEGLNGVSLNLSHEKNIPLNSELEIIRYQANGNVALSQKVPVNLTGRGHQQWNVEALLEQFFDISYAYKFGPKEYMLIHARLYSKADADVDSGQVLGECFYYPSDMGLQLQAEPEIQTIAVANNTGYALTVSTKNFARAVTINAYPYTPSDNYFDLAPNSCRTIALKAPAEPKPLRGSVAAFNSLKTHTINIIQQK